LVGWLVGWLVGELVSLFVCYFVCWLVGWLVGWLVATCIRTVQTNNIIWSISGQIVFQMQHTFRILRMTVYSWPHHIRLCRPQYIFNQRMIFFLKLVNERQVTTNRLDFLYCNDFLKTIRPEYRTWYPF
jgi:hypothetical protein